MSDKDRRILLGRIAGAQGIRGEVVVHSYAGNAADVAAYGPLENESGDRRFELTVLRVTPKGVIARVAGIADRTAAETLKGTTLYVAREKLPPAEAHEFYHADLIGLAAEDASGRRIGRVVSVENYGAGDLLEIQLEGARATELIPFTDAFVPVVDIAGGRVVVEMPQSDDDDNDDADEA